MSNAGKWSEHQRGARASHWWFVALIIVVVVVVIVVLSRRPSPPAGELAVGVVFPMSGNLGYVGQMEADGMRLAVEDINAKAGPNDIRLRLQIDDSQGKPDVGVTAAKKMMNVDGIKVICSSISSVTLALKPVVEAGGGILIGCCMHPDFYRQAPRVFRFYEGVEQESQGFVEYFRNLAAQKSNVVTGALYADVPNVREQLDDYIRPELRKLGLDFAAMEPFQLSDKEFRDKVIKLKSAGVTNLLLLGYGFEYPNIFKALKEQKVLPNIEIVGGWGFLYAKVPKEDLEGVTVIGPAYVFQQPPKIQDFHARFKERFGYEANFDAVMTYAAIELIAAAARVSKSVEPEALAASLTSLRNVDTLLGATTVDSEGAVVFDIGMGVFRNGMISPDR